MTRFAVVRLGKDSVADIRALDGLHTSPASPIELSLNCKQVPTELVVGDYVFICFGSDNSQGAPTDWVRGVRALGRVIGKTGGPGYNDPWNVRIEVGVVLPESVVRRDLLGRAPSAYYWCSGVPIIGIEANSQQTVQMIKSDETDQNVAALAYALAAHSPVFKVDTTKVYPELATLFAYSPPSPEAALGEASADSPRDSRSLSELVDRFRVDAGICQLRVQSATAQRIACSLLSKRFLIATGLAGSGKTKVAQALARWMTPRTENRDPFVVGAKFESDRVVYVIKNADSVGVEFWNEGAGDEEPTKNMVPREVITEWATYIRENDINEDVSAQVISNAVESTSQFSAYLHRFRPFLKLAAFALLKAGATPVPVNRCEVIAVGADWTGNENILGYPNGLDEGTYLTKPALELILHAHDKPDVPHFLILDEMNLSHVERYFADILSAIESEARIPLHRDTERVANGRVIPQDVKLPSNLFIIGTVNVDETTYMFSPKVLDRANVIEFRMTPGEIQAFLNEPAKPDLSNLDGRGIGFGKAFVEAARGAATVAADAKEAFGKEMALFFNVMQPHGAEFGYRVAQEAARFLHFYKLLGSYPDDGAWFPGGFDCVVVQKFLPKLHGSKAKLGPLLKKLWFLCVNDEAGRGAEPLKYAEEAARSTDKKFEPSVLVPNGAPYSISAEKIGRMWRLLSDNGFASFAEA